MVHRIGWADHGIQEVIHCLLSSLSEMGLRAHKTDEEDHITLWLKQFTQFSSPSFPCKVPEKTQVWVYTGGDFCLTSVVQGFISYSSITKKNSTLHVSVCVMCWYVHMPVVDRSQYQVSFST